MDWASYVVPSVVAITGMPAFLLAGMLRRGNLGALPRLVARGYVRPEALARRLSYLLMLAGFSLVAGGAGLVWAGSDQGRTMAVVVPLVVLVNALAIAMIVTVMRAGRHPGAGRQ